MNPFTQIANTLSARSPKRSERPHSTTTCAKPNKTMALRDYLRDIGPATAVTLADEVGLDRVDLVSALLAKDLLRGRIERVGNEYRFNHQYDDAVRSGEQDMARTLRRAGWTVTPPSTGDAQYGPATETITWVEMSTGAPMPDAFELVLCELQDSPEPVWAGCWDGAQWCDAFGDPTSDTVIAWARMPAGRKGGAE